MFDFWVTTLHVVLVSGLIVLALLVLRRAKIEQDEEAKEEVSTPDEANEESAHFHIQTDDDDEFPPHRE